MSKLDQNINDAPALQGAVADDDPPSTLSSILSFAQGIIPLIIAIFILWYFGTALKRMFTLTTPNITEVEWGRNVYLYGALEALAFAAAGFLFGREVNRQRAEQAEKNADSAQRKANAANAAAATNAANGRALAEGVRAFADTPAEEALGVQAASPAMKPTGLRALRRMADSMFPAS